MSDMIPETRPASPRELDLGRRFSEQVLDPMKSAFVGKDEIIDLMGISLVACENLFILGPPGTAKSALVQNLGARIEGRVFDYLLTRFTEPNELFGPFDIRKLREGELLTNTEGMLPEADFVFLDELLNANSAILNSLLMVLNERVFRRGRETRRLPTLMVVGASNRLPEDEALCALFDRFLLRVRCDNVPPEQLNQVLSAGWKLDMHRAETAASVTTDDLRNLHRMLHDVDLSKLRVKYAELIQRLRHAGVQVSDRRAVKLQRLLAASALLCGRLEVNTTDLWVLRYVWDTEEQRDILASLVQDALERAGEDERRQAHPRSSGADTVDAEQLARGLESLAERLAGGDLPATDRSYVRDQLGLLSGRCQWVVDAQQREFLEKRVEALWDQMGEPR